MTTYYEVLTMKDFADLKDGDIVYRKLNCTEDIPILSKSLTLYEEFVVKVVVDSANREIILTDRDETIIKSKKEQGILTSFVCRFGQFGQIRLYKRVSAKEHLVGASGERTVQVKIIDVDDRLDDGNPSVRVETTDGEEYWTDLENIDLY